MDATLPGLDPQTHAWLMAKVGRPREVFFFAQSMSTVWGVLLESGERVAVKRRGGERLATLAAAHRAAHAGGIDTPALLAGPSPAHSADASRGGGALPTGAGGGDGSGDGREDGPGNGGGDAAWLTAERWRPEGAATPERDGVAVDAPALYATLLARVIEALRGVAVPAQGLEPPPWQHYDHGSRDRVWPPAVSPKWDPHRPDAGIPDQLVDLAAAAARRLRETTLPSVLGHADLNSHNVRWVGAHAIVHDWDSVAWRPEAVLAGTVAVDYPSAPQAGAIASIADSSRVLTAYQRAMGRDFTPEETEVAWAAGVWVACYNASFEYLHGAAGPVGERIMADGAQRLALAGVSGRG